MPRYIFIIRHIIHISSAAHMHGRTSVSFKKFRRYFYRFVKYAHDNYVIILVYLNIHKHPVISHKNYVIFALKIKGNHLYDCLVCYLYFCFFFGGALYRSCQYGSIVMCSTRNVFKSIGLTFIFGTFGFLFTSLAILSPTVHLSYCRLSPLPRSQYPCENHSHTLEVCCQPSQISFCLP